MPPFQSFLCGETERKRWCSLIFLCGDSGVSPKYGRIMRCGGRGTKTNWSGKPLQISVRVFCSLRVFRMLCVLFQAGFSRICGRLGDKQITQQKPNFSQIQFNFSSAGCSKNDRRFPTPFTGNWPLEAIRAPIRKLVGSV